MANFLSYLQKGFCRIMKMSLLCAAMSTGKEDLGNLNAHPPGLLPAVHHWQKTTLLCVQA